MTMTHQQHDPAVDAGILCAHLLYLTDNPVQGPAGLDDHGDGADYDGEEAARWGRAHAAHLEIRDADGLVELLTSLDDGSVRFIGDRMWRDGDEDYRGHWVRSFEDDVHVLVDLDLLDGYLTPLGDDVVELIRGGGLDEDPDADGGAQ